MHLTFFWEGVYILYKSPRPGPPPSGVHTLKLPRQSLQPLSTAQLPTVNQVVCVWSAGVSGKPEMKITQFLTSQWRGGRADHLTWDRSSPVTTQAATTARRRGTFQSQGWRRPLGDAWHQVLRVSRTRSGEERSEPATPETTAHPFGNNVSLICFFQKKRWTTQYWSTAKKHDCLSRVQRL